MSGPEFGPGGYLPPKASQRARKIVLREQMGTGWPLAALVAAVVVAVAGGVYLFVSTRAPGRPFLEMGPLTQVEPGSGLQVHSAPEGPGAFVVRAGASVKAFATEPADIRWCAQTERIENEAMAWSADGRLVHGEGESLTPLPSVVHAGLIYVDTSTRLSPPPPAPGGEPPVCMDG